MNSQTFDSDQQEAEAWASARKLKHLDLFSGIGGFALGLQMAGGFETVGFCEIDPYCQKVLAQHWPDVPVLGDIHDLSADALVARGVRGVDIISAGFPCQPFSQAGKQRGIDDERFLWPELFRVIGEVKPSYLLLENVPRLLTVMRGLVFGGILYDLRQIGFNVEWQVISANDVGAWHKRERLWIVAYPNRHRRDESRTISIPDTDAQWHVAPQKHAGQTVLHAPRSGGEDVSDSRFSRLEWNRSARFVFTPPQSQKISSRRRRTRSRGGIWETEPAVGRVVDGIPYRVDRIKALGNAVVPQIVEIIGAMIFDHFERRMK